VDANDRDWLGLHDRVCVITGAASGIGRETAIQFATVGARVVAIDRDGNGCSRTAEEVQQKRPELQAHSRIGIRSGCGLPVAMGAEP
jgi:NAD(P)-dependent dehydrogenase (short-subunit alcohol dehydrogenase family)